MRSGMIVALLAIAAGAGGGVPAGAGSRDIVLDPAHARLEFRAFAFGVLPLPGRFGRFSGVLTVDPAVPGACRVRVRVETASLEMENPSIRADVLSPALLDAARFPVMAFEGACRDGSLRGTLTLHGTVRPFAMDLERAGATYIAEGTLRRGDFGITGRPVLAGQQVTLRVVASVRSDELTLSAGP